MDVIYPSCCGLDIHKKLIVACRKWQDDQGRLISEVRSFTTMTRDILALADWLQAVGCTHVAMESTGVYWVPIYNLLESQFTLLVVNAQHIKAVPGRKTDVKDAEWIADLLRHGLLRASFIPDAPQREVRELTRARTHLVEDRTRVVNRLQKTLEGTNIKLASVVSDIMGASARDMLALLLAGETDRTVLLGAARGKLADKKAALDLALEGQIRPHQALLLRLYLRQIDDLDTEIAGLTQEIDERLRPFAAEHARLVTIPGVSDRIAQIVLSEIGTQMARFPDAAHLSSWAGMCPGNHQSAGKRLSGRIRPGNAALRRALVEAAHAAAHTKDTYLAAQYHRLVGKRGKKRALLAVGHTILVIIWHLLTHKTTYTDLGGNYFDDRDRERVAQRLAGRIRRMGYAVNVTESPAA